MIYYDAYSRLGSARIIFNVSDSGWVTFNGVRGGYYFYIVEQVDNVNSIIWYSYGIFNVDYNSWVLCSNTFGENKNSSIGINETGNIWVGFGEGNYTRCLIIQFNAI